MKLVAFVILAAAALCILTASCSSLDGKNEKSFAKSDSQLRENIQYPREWHLWKAQHQKSYESTEHELSRHLVWLSNKKYIEEHNKHANVTGYGLEMNQFGDLTSKEFHELYMCVQDHQPRLNASVLNARYSSDKFQDYKPTSDANVPDSIDWRTGGAVTKVKDQLRCGCSYAFAAMAALEGVTALAHGYIEKLSEQNIVDCSLPYGNHGCACGDINIAYLYVIDNGGVDTWHYYPYEAKQYACFYDVNGRGATARGIVTIDGGNEKNLLSAVANVGPVATYVDGSHSAFQFYAYGVLDMPYCYSNRLSHAMVIIGYGTSNGKDYWLLKNSWGPHWGERGYIKMSRNKNNQCGIATAASFPTL